MRTFLLTLPLIVACEDKDVASEGAHCEDTAIVVDLDEVTSLGFAASDLLALAEGEHTSPLTWARGGDTNVAISVVHDGGEARFVDSEAVYPEGDDEYAAIGVECPDRVEVDVSLALATDDGEFDEAWDLPLQGETAELASFRQELDIDGLHGTYDMSLDITEPDYDDRRAWVSGDFDATGTSGVIEGQVSGEDECDDGEECTAWAAQVDIATWGGDVGEE